MAQTIYETKGRAQEYNYLAVNLYQGCGHGCRYCYAPEVVHASKESFFNDPQPRANILHKLDHDARVLMNQGVHGPVLLCFTCDPYQPIEDKYHLTANTIDILHRYGLNVSILTKAGPLATYDLAKFEKGDEFGVTLTFDNEIETRQWEPEAGLSFQRIKNLAQAHELGIKTWVSCEPVINPEATLNLIYRAAPYTDLFKVGKLNYLPSTINWQKFAQDAINLLEKLSKHYYIKKDLAQYLGQPEGICG
jgi:DNA repair photolyase